MEDLKSSEYSSEWLCERASELLPTLWSSVIPLLYVTETRAGVQGTGTLLQIADRRFVITAEHVVRDYLANKLGIYTTDYADAKELVPLNGKVVYESDWDIAILEVEDKAADALPNRQFLRTCYADRFGSPLHDGWTVIHGFPSSWTTGRYDDRELNIRPYTRIATYYAGDKQRLPGFDERAHIALDHRSDRVLTPHVLREDSPSSLYGISGSTIWQIFRAGESQNEWKAENAKILGIETAVYGGGKYVKAIRWIAVECIFRHAFPELASAMDVVVPERQRPDGNVEGLELFDL